MSTTKFKCERLWSVDVVMEKLGVSRLWLYHRSKQLGFPHRKVAGRLLFDPVEIDAWIETQPGISASYRTDQTAEPKKKKRYCDVNINESLPRLYDEKGNRIRSEDLERYFTVKWRREHSEKVKAALRAKCERRVRLFKRETLPPRDTKERLTQILAEDFTREHSDQIKAGIARKKLLRRQILQD